MRAPGADGITGRLESNLAAAREDENVTCCQAAFGDFGFELQVKNQLEGSSTRQAGGLRRIQDERNASWRERRSRQGKSTRL
jgi:hypothetical protein